VVNAQEISQLPPDQIKGVLSQLSAQDLKSLISSWKFWARPEQLPPEGDWTTWLFFGGRGAGKTRSGAEYMKDVALTYPGIRMGLVGPTRSDVRDTMIHGSSGLLGLHYEEGQRPRHIPTKRSVVWPNGSFALAFSAEEPERFRGPNLHFLWADELSTWRYLDECWALMSLALRLEYPGFQTPRIYISTTPRPLSLLKEIINEPSTVITRATTFANRANLSKKFFETIVAHYEKSTLGRQEIYGELIDDVTGALWKRKTIDLNRTGSARPQLGVIVVAVDPATSDKASANECGIIVAGLGQDQKGYIIGDYSTHGVSPAVWGKKVVDVFIQHGASYVVAEGNLGGGLVETVIRQINSHLPIKFVQAKRGKYLRAEPVAMLYEQGRVKHVGHFHDLEDQMCRFTASYEKENPGQSPDRVDALVWAIAALMLESMYDTTMRWVAN
jgi:phage terminase large subunit-like protein